MQGSVNSTNAVNSVNDLKDFKSCYHKWLERVRWVLEEGRYKDALSDYPFIKHHSAPWTPFSGDLSKKRLAMVSTAGLYIKGYHAPYDAENIEGDWTHREIPLDTDLDRLEIAHTHYNHQSALKDLNSVFPVALLKEMRDAGEIGSLAETIYSFGFCLQADRVSEITAPAMLQKMRAEGVEVALFVPV